MVRAKETHHVTNQMQENDIYGLSGTGGAFFGSANTLSSNGALGDAAGVALGNGNVNNNNNNNGNGNGNGNINSLNRGLTNGAEGKFKKFVRCCSAGILTYIRTLHTYR